jgi:hypothetical protein
MGCGDIFAVLRWLFSVGRGTINARVAFSDDSPSMPGLQFGLNEAYDA